MSREMALGYLDALVPDTARHRQLTRAERERSWRGADGSWCALDTRVDLHLVESKCMTDDAHAKGALRS